MSTILKNEDSIAAIVKEMSLEEKASMISGESPFRSRHFEKYQIPSIFMLDSCNGLNSMEYAGEAVYQKISEAAAAEGKPLDPEENGNMGGLLIALNTLKKEIIERAKNGTRAEKQENPCFPPGICMGASWNPNAIETVGHAKAKYMGSLGIDMILGPNINIHRDPLCGRLAESYSEDPYLVSQLAPAEIKGIQSEGLIAVAKHFAANNQEKDRMGVEEHVPERALREIYLPGFKACADAGCKAFMSAYNKQNGMPSAQNKYLLTDILRKEWGFQGFVVSDWGASYDLVKAVDAGTDLTMPGPRGIREVVAAVQEGRLAEEKLDQCVTNILHAVLHTPSFTGKRPIFAMNEAITAAEQMAKEGMILLENDGTLPLDRNCDLHLTFYGKRSKEFVSCPEGSSKVITDLCTNPYDRALELLGNKRVLFERFDADTKYWIVCVGANGHEGSDRTSLDIDEDEKLILEKAITEAESHNGKVILVINATGPVNLLPYRDRVNAILCPFFAGMQGGKVTTDTLFGLNNPSGKLPLTWPVRYEDCPAFKNYPGENKEVWYGEGIYVGYRWYDARKIEPMYPFGYGMSYTDFTLSDMRICCKSHKDTVRMEENKTVLPGETCAGNTGQRDIEWFDVEQDSILVSLNVTNNGKAGGSEVVQLYLMDPESPFDRPIQELKGFQKVYLEPGETKCVTMELTKESFAGYYAAFHEWITVPGRKMILAGTSSRDIKQKAEIEIRCKNPFGLSRHSGIGEIAKNKEAVAVVNDIIEEDLLLISHVAIEFAPDTSLEAIWNGTAMRDVFQKKQWSDKQLQERWEKLLSRLADL